MEHQGFQAQVPSNFSLPKRINRLGELAYNLWWTWNPESQRLFSRIDPVLWERIYHNPVIFLRQVERARLNAATNNRFYLEMYDRMMSALDEYMGAKETWFSKQHPQYKNKQVAYLSFEFGLHETLPIYAGGLGVLSGDHTKEASDLGLPFAAIGFFYSEGYFTQRLTEDGWQEASYNAHPFDQLPVLPVTDEAGKPLMVGVELPGREVKVRIWKLQVGRVPLYLLDANNDANSQQDRGMTARLYSGDPELRISQEMLLGIGGVRALRLLGYNPDVWHMNEGHAAFLVLERLREYLAQGMTLEEAGATVRSSNIFTTHTPVPAGNDEFQLWLVDKYFANWWPQLGISRDAFMDLARHQVNYGETFSMPALALRYSESSNGVSELHGQVARKMWQYLWPETPERDVPITHITNGIHTSTWLARRLMALYQRHLGESWMERLDDPDAWEGIKNIPDEQLWTVRLHLKRKLASYIRERARGRWHNGGWQPSQVVASGVMIDPYALTIGFARRFAPYKRANLVLRDMDRLLRILNDRERPVQVIFAGKSHPDHEQGKMIIQDVYRAVKNNASGGRLVFLEEYDMNLARYLVQGVDVWLNTPRRPNEASGTSGEKAAVNGVLNFSVLDGWWREGYNGQNGWAIGQDIDYEYSDKQDDDDARSLYDTLEKEIVPLYYSLRSSDGLPAEWIGRMKESIRTIGPTFSMRRMVKEYLERFYLPAMEARPAVEPAE
ncbi:MAG: alpha-glucan family phosphorylase [Chloroflexota bacterium]